MVHHLTHIKKDLGQKCVTLWSCSQSVSDMNSFWKETTVHFLEKSESSFSATGTKTVSVNLHDIPNIFQLVFPHEAPWGHKNSTPWSAHLKNSVSWDSLKGPVLRWPLTLTLFKITLESLYIHFLWYSMLWFSFWFIIKLSLSYHFVSSIGKKKKSVVNVVWFWGEKKQNNNSPVKFSKVQNKMFRSPVPLSG